MGSGSGKRRKTASMHGNNLGISIKQRKKQYSKGEQLSPSAFAISRIPTCQKVSLWTKTEGFWGFCCGIYLGCTIWLRGVGMTCPLENIVVSGVYAVAPTRYSLFSPLSPSLHLAPRALGLQAHDLLRRSWKDKAHRSKKETTLMGGFFFGCGGGI